MLLEWTVKGLQQVEKRAGQRDKWRERANCIGRQKTKEEDQNKEQSKISNH